MSVSAKTQQIIDAVILQVKNVLLFKLLIGVAKSIPRLHCGLTASTSVLLYSLASDSSYFDP